MRKLLSSILALWISVSPFLNGMLKVALAAPTVGAPVLSVSTVPVGVATTITSTSRITSGPGDPAVVATGVNLLRVDANNVVLSTVGTMRDDGLNGDAVANDGEFTLRFTVTEQAAGILRVRVSAPFRGVSQRVLSPVGSVPVQVVQNQPPTFTSTAPTSATVGFLYSYQATAQDPEGGALKFQLVSGPTGLTIGQTTGLVQWTPTASQTGKQNVSIKVSDPKNASATQTFTISVAANQPPAFTSTPPTNATVGVLYSYQATAQDPEGGAVNFQLVSGPSGMVVGQNTGLVQWTPTAAQAGKQNVQLRVSDPQNLTANQDFTIQVAAPNLPPTITSAPVVTAKENTLYQYQVAAQDPEGATLTYQLLSAPSGMTISQTTGLIQWTPVKAQVGAQSVQLKVSDPQNAAATQNFTVQVAAANQAPTITSVPLTTAKPTLLYLYQVTAQDPENGTLTHQLVNGPAGMTIGAVSGLVQWMPTTAQIGNQNVQIKVVDAQGAEAAQNFTIAVTELNLPPTITSVPTTFAKTTEPYVYNVTAYDPEKKPIQFSFSGTQPSGMTINATSGAVNWSPSVSQVGNYPIAIRATDPGGAFDTQTFNLKVLDPANDLQITSPTGPQSIRIGQTLTLPLRSNYAGAAFSVNPSLTNGAVAGSDFTFKPTQDQEGVQTVTFKAVYGDMQKSVVIPITVTRDNSAPVIVPIAAQTVQEGASLTFTVAATDADSDPLTYTAPGLSLANAFFNTTSRQFTFNPIVGQAGSYQVTFSVSDTRSTSQITVAIQVTKSTGQQQVLDLVVDPVSNPTLLGSATISGNITGQQGTPPPKQVPPIVTGLVPSVAKQGQTVTVQITGLNTTFGQTTSRADFGDGIIVNSLAVNSATSAQATLTIDKAARIGTRTMRMLGAGSDAPSVVSFSIEKGVASISGVVTDPVTGQPLGGARVSINGTTLSALTDSQGRFTLSGVPTGSVPLLITLPNYDVQQLTIGVGASEEIALPDVIKMNALARPPQLAGTLPRAATVASVLDRGIASSRVSMTLEEAKAAISDTMLVVGGSQAGVLDENGNQLNPKVQGNGVFTLRPQGVENHARMLRLGKTYRLGDIFLQLRGTYSFMFDFPSDSEMLFSFQSAVNQAWANPEQPTSAMPLVLFSTGTTRPAQAPILSLDTQVNSFQAFLIHASFLSFYAVDIVQFIRDYAKSQGLPQPQFGALSPVESAERTYAARVGNLVAGLARAISTVLGPREALADEMTVAERRLAEQEAWEFIWNKSKSIKLKSDFVAGAIPGLALAFFIGTTANILSAPASVGSAALSVLKQMALGAIVGGALAALIGILQGFGFDNAKGLNPDPPLGQTTRLVNGQVEIVFSKSSGDSLSVKRLPDGSIERRTHGEFYDPTVTGALSRLVDFGAGVLQPSELEYFYFIYKVRNVDDEDVTNNAPLPIAPEPIYENGREVIDKLKFTIPSNFLTEGPNYFRMVTAQRFRGTSRDAAAASLQPYHYSDAGIEIPSLYSEFAGKALTFTLGLSSPGWNFAAFARDVLRVPESWFARFPKIKAGLNPFVLDPTHPWVNYLDPLFKDSTENAEKALAEATKAQLDNQLKANNYQTQIEQDILAQRALKNGQQARLQELNTARVDLLKTNEGLRARLQGLTNGLSKLLEVGPDWVTNSEASGAIAEGLGVSGGIPAETAQLLSEYQEVSVRLKDARDSASALKSYRSKLETLEWNLRTYQQGTPNTRTTISVADVANFKVEGRPSFSALGSGATFDIKPSFQSDVVIRVNGDFTTTTPISDVPIAIEQPGQPTQQFKLGELLEAEALRQNILNERVGNFEILNQAAANEIRSLRATEAEMNGFAKDLKAIDVSIDEVNANIAEIDTKIGNLSEVNVAETVPSADPRTVQAKEVNLARVKAFVSIAGKVTNVISVVGTVLFYFDTRRALQASVASSNSYLSPTETVFVNKRTATSTVRIASDPLVDNGILSVHHLTLADLAPNDPNRNRRYPIVDGSVGLSVFHRGKQGPEKDIIPNTGFPSDYFAVDSKGRIYANNANSNETFGGRIFRFTRPSGTNIPVKGAGVQRDFAGSINFYGLDAFLPPQPAEPIAMGIGDSCCFNDQIVESPFVADIDFSATPPKGRIRRIPVELIDVPNARIVGQTVALSEDLKLATPSTLVAGLQVHNVNLQSPGRPIFVSDGPRIWMLTQSSLATFDLIKIIDTPNRQWAGLLVDDLGCLMALDASSGDVWFLTPAVVQSAIRTAPIDTDAKFDEVAFKVATGFKNGLDLASTTKQLGFLVAASGGEIEPVGAAIIGVLPKDVPLKSLELYLPRLGIVRPVEIYTSGEKKRFLAHIPPLLGDFNEGTLIATLNNEQQRKYHIPFVGPYFGVFHVPEDLLERILKGQP